MLSRHLTVAEKGYSCYTVMAFDFDQRKSEANKTQTRH